MWLYRLANIYAKVTDIAKTRKRERERNKKIYDCTVLCSHMLHIFQWCVQTTTKRPRRKTATWPNAFAFYSHVYISKCDGNNFFFAGIIWRIVYMLHTLIIIKLVRVFFPHFFLGSNRLNRPIKEGNIENLWAFNWIHAN